MLINHLLFALTQALQSPGNTGLIVDYQLVENSRIAVPVRIGNSPPQPFVLSLGEPISTAQTAQAKAPVPITIGNANFGKLSLLPQPKSAGNVRGILGRDFLKGMAIGIDIDSSEIVLWRKGNLTPAVAQAWTTGLSTSPNKRVDRIPFVSPTPKVSISIAGGHLAAELELQMFASIFIEDALPIAARMSAPNKESLLLASAAIGGETIPWLQYVVPPSDFKAAYKKRFLKRAISATLGLDTLTSKRVLIDLAANSIYFEKLSPDEKISLFLSRELMAPLTVKGDRILLESCSGPHGADGFGDLLGSAVLAIAGQPTSHWLEALRDPSKRSALAALLRKLESGYAITVRAVDGENHEISMP